MGRKSSEEVGRAKRGSGERIAPLEKTSRDEKILGLVLGIYIMVFAVCVFAVVYFAPPQMAEFKVFDVYYRDNNQTTIVYTYGKGQFIMMGHYDFEPHHRYRIWYKTRFGGRPQLDCIIEDIEELGLPP